MTSAIDTESPNALRTIMFVENGVGQLATYSNDELTDMFSTIYIMRLNNGERISYGRQTVFDVVLAALNEHDDIKEVRR